MSLRSMSVVAMLAAGCGSGTPQAPQNGDLEQSPAHDGSAILDGGTTLAFTTTTSALLANNTSASSFFRDAYVPDPQFAGSTTPVGNGGNPTSATSTTDFGVGLVSKLPIRSLLYPGATTKLFVETQGWFCTNGTTPIPTGAKVDLCGSHIDVGYDSNFTDHAKLQIADMRSRGIDGAIMDWSGQSKGKGTTDAKATSPASINSGTMFAYKNAAEADGTFQLAALEDQGITACAKDTSCDIEAALLADLDFLAANVYGSSAYLKQGTGNRPVVFFFSLDATVAFYNRTPINWANIRAGAKGNPLFVFENANGYTHANSDGAYSWINVTKYASYPGADPFGLTTFLPNIYSKAVANPTKLTWTSAYKGFDDNLVNGWGNGRRYIGQVCGKTWLDTLALAGKYYSTTSQLPNLQLITWDDYEEGSELETGIDNHLAISATASGTVLSWTAALASDAPEECKTGFDVMTTVDHFTVYASTDGTSLAELADVPVGTTTLDVAALLPSGAYQLYVYAMGKASLTNHLSNAVAITR